jgi:hypothetical protein
MLRGQIIDSKTEIDEMTARVAPLKGAMATPSGLAQCSWAETGAFRLHRQNWSSFGLIQNEEEHP